MGGIGGGEELKWHQLAHHQLMSQQGPHFSPQSKSKVNYKSTNLRKMVTGGISDVAIASVHSEKTRLKELIRIIIIIMNLSQETKVVTGPEIDFRNETEARKVMVDFKFDTLYR